MVMPIYEFHCGSCDTDSEILVSSTNWKGAKCPHCNSTKLEKKLSVFASACAGGNASAASTKPVRTGGCCGGGPHRH